MAARKTSGFTERLDSDDYFDSKPYLYSYDGSDSEHDSGDANFLEESDGYEEVVYESEGEVSRTDFYQKILNDAVKQKMETEKLLESLFRSS